MHIEAKLIDHTRISVTFMDGDVVMHSHVIPTAKTAWTDVVARWVEEEFPLVYWIGEWEYGARNDSAPIATRAFHIDE